MNRPHDYSTRLSCISCHETLLLANVLFLIGLCSLSSVQPLLSATSFVGLNLMLVHSLFPGHTVSAEVQDSRGYCSFLGCPVSGREWREVDCIPKP